MDSNLIDKMKLNLDNNLINKKIKLIISHHLKRWHKSLNLFMFFKC